MVRFMACLAAVVAVAGCEPVTGPLVSLPPKARPETVDSTPLPPSPESQALAAYYAEVERGHLTRGLLRGDGGGPDVPFDARRVAETFEVLAFQREFAEVGGTIVRRSEETMLHRWAGPVRIETAFGPSVGNTARTDDQATVEAFAARLARVTRHRIGTVARGGNFHVLFLNEDERKVVGPLLQRLVPEIRQSEIDVIESLPRETYCIVLSSDPANNGVTTRAVAVIRAELPPLLRLSCIHEEIAQGLGLPNDSPDARPSIFNDDDEFGRLTAMDEVMLELLYHPSLRPGISAETAAPIVRGLTESRLGGAS